MIFRISTKISKRYLTPDRHCRLTVIHLRIGRYICSLSTVSNTCSSRIQSHSIPWSCLTRTEGRAIVPERITDYMSNFIRSAGHESIVDKFIAPSMDTVRFSKALNRSVIGSMNDFIWGAKFHLTEGDLSLFEVGLLLNETPMSYLGRSSPMDIFPGLQATKAIDKTPPASYPGGTP